MIESDKKYTAFEANGKLYQFRRIPFGICNAVGAFQRIMTKIVDEDNLESTYPYLDDVTIAASLLPELKENQKRFEESCKKLNMTINKTISVREADCLNILGHQIKHEHISPDPDRPKPLMDIPVPSNSITCLFGLFCYLLLIFPTKIFIQ